ncbi:MAG: hypothetical protein ACK58Q_11040, partial [Chitinophagales bacterium]
MERKKKKCTKEQNEKPSPSAIGGDRRMGLEWWWVVFFCLVFGGFVSGFLACICFLVARSGLA